MEQQVAEWARVEAAKQDTSVSRFVGQLLKEKMQNISQYDKAKKSYLSKSKVSDLSGGSKYVDRDELYDR